MTKAPRSRPWIVWLAILVMFLVVWAGGLLWQAPLAHWKVGPEDVAAELARRAEAGDPVQAELLEWEPGLPGRAWSEVLSEPRDGRALLRDPAALKEAVVPLVERLLALSYAPATTHAIPDADLWELDAEALAKRWEELRWEERDPARLRSRTFASDVDREVRFGVHHADTTKLCSLGCAPGLEGFHAVVDANFGASETSARAPLDPLWSLRLGDSLNAELHSGTRFGLSRSARASVKRLRCLERAMGEPVTMMHGLTALAVRDRFTRTVEAELPFLEWDERAELLALAAAQPAIDPSAHFARLLRVERAFAHAVYARAFAEHGGEGLGLVGWLWPGRPMHGAFLQLLDDYDAVLAVVESKSGYVATRAQLEELDRLRRERDEDYSAVFGFVGSTGVYTSVVRHEALRRLVLVAKALLDEGSAAAHARAAEIADPFGDGVLRTRGRDDEVFEVWSVGENGSDDGGVTADEPGGKDLDLVLRIPQFEALPRDEE